MRKRGCLRDSVSGSRCFPGEQFGENRDKQLTTVRDNQLWFLCFLSFCFFEMFFSSQTEWWTSDHCFWQLALNSELICYKVSTALTAVAGCQQHWQLFEAVLKGLPVKAVMAAVTFTVVGSFDSWNKLSSVLASCFNLLTAVASGTSCR